jgi:hypothetical protein
MGHVLQVEEEARQALTSMGHVLQVEEGASWRSQI